MNPIESGFELIEVVGTFIMFAWIVYLIGFAVVALQRKANGITKADLQRDELARYRK